MRSFLGIAREPVFSPGKVEADRAIIESVGAVLRNHGHRVEIVSAEETLSTPRPGTMVFTMAQGSSALATLRRWEEGGIAVVNSVESVLHCHRHRMIDRFRRARVAAPESVVLFTDHADELPGWIEESGAWLKRGDVHATEADDVAFVDGRVAAIDALRRFRGRGIGQAVLQRHVEGVVIKFYAVADRVLAWYPPAETRLTLTPPQISELGTLANAGARSLGLDVYGGDCIATAEGDLQLIDLNDWPSYAPCRAAAAEAIAVYLEEPTESSES
jgi:GNAT superfamily N-acetyltransferase